MSDEAFRKIRPSLDQSSNSISLHPSSSLTDTSSGSSGQKDPGDPKRRKAPEYITRNACLSCKKARAKCDGRTPCKRCSARLKISECIYEIHNRHTKKQLVKQIKQLQVKDFRSQQIFQALQTEDRAPEIMERMKIGESHESIIKWLSRSAIDDLEAISPRESTGGSDDHDMGASEAETNRWASISSNNMVLDHLFLLYFAWIHPVYTLFDQGQFLNSYHNGGPYCSPILVNAVCAMACHLHTKSEQDSGLHFDQLSNEFIQAVRGLMDADDYQLTTIQALAVMFLVEAGRGNGLRAASYLRVAISSLPRVTRQEKEGPRTVWNSTVRGIQNLNVEWSQITFQVPYRINVGPIEGGGNEDQIDEVSWHFYTTNTCKFPARPSFQATTSREKHKLITIINDVNVALYSQQPPKVSAQLILALFGRFVTWLKELPDVIADMENKKIHTLPHVLSLMILYNNSIVQLLRPLLSYEGFLAQQIEDIVGHHAQLGMSLLNEQYRPQFSCRYQPVLQMYSMLHFIDVIAHHIPSGIENKCKNGSEAIKAGMDMLEQSAPGFPVASLMQEMLRKTAVSCSIRYAANDAGLQFPSHISKKRYQMDDFIRACTRPSYMQPVDEVKARFMPTLVQDWLEHCSAYGFLDSIGSEKTPKMPLAEDLGPQGLMQIRALLNDA